MQKILTGATMGQRIVALRRAQGFSTARALAEAIPGGVVSVSAVQNIESGRKPDLHVGQLLAIAAALKVSPIYLLVPVGLPESAVNMPAAGNDVSNMTVAEFEEWVSQGDLWPGSTRGPLDHSLQRVRHALREAAYLNGRVQEFRADDRNRDLLKQWEVRLRSLRDYLLSEGVDVTWIAL